MDVSADSGLEVRRVLSNRRIRPWRAAAWALAALLAVGAAGLWLGGGVEPAAATTPPTVSAAPTTVASGTTVVPIGNQLPAPPVTLPLTTRPASAHVDPLLAKLSLAGFAFVILLLLIQAVLTRPRRRPGRWTL